nr:LlaJI family restriction endonuclease [Acinetobacter sp. Marseille-Q1620]
MLNSENRNLLVDRYPLDHLPEFLSTFFKSRGLLSSISGQKISFCGLVSHSGQNYFFFPRKTDLKTVNEDTNRYVSILMKALLRFAINSKTRIYNPEQDPDIIGFEKLEQAKFLIQDYLSNGILRNELVAVMKNSGKTSWGITINKSSPFPDKAGNPLYLDQYGKKRTSSNNEITRIHAGILLKVFKQFGFILSTENQIPDALHQYGISDLSSESQILLLNNELRNHFADRPIRLIKAMISFLHDQKGTTSANHVIGITKFHVAWEHMLDSILKDTIDINNRLPKPVYIDINNTPKIANRFGMKTDIVIEDKVAKKLTILDAKYYEATTVENAPGWPDLVKQFFYEKAIAELTDFKSYTFENFLVFPGKKQVFKTVKMIDTKTDHFINSHFKPIKCHYVDPLELLEIYSSNRKITFKS